MSMRRISIVYRVVVGVLAVLSFVAALDCYVAHSINENYFPNQSHRRDLLMMGAFAVLFVALAVEAWRLHLLRIFIRRKNGDA